MKKILFVFGTRPEAIKMAPVIKIFKENLADFKTKTCVTAQHREMLDQVLEFFEITPDYDLNLMRPNQNLHELTASMIKNLKTVFDDFTPDYLFVHGDTTTSMASSIAAFYSGIKICHIEAGLRTFDKLSPFPEEMNRQIVGRISDYHFAPTLIAKQNLLKENIKESKILITGNTVIDALFQSIEKTKDLSNETIDSLKLQIEESSEIILVTGHRRENHGNGFEKICLALKEIAEKRPDVKIIYPVHLNPNVQDPVKKILSNLKNVILLDPLSYPNFIWLMNKSNLIITDSGGIQEEAPSLGKPVLVMRETSERPEAIEAGTVVLVGTNKNKIIEETLDLLENKERYKIMSELSNPYGDGFASKKILEFIKKL